MMAFVFGEILRTTLSRSSKAVSGSISANTGIAPDRMIPRVVAKAVIGVVITSSPGPICKERKMISIASIPLPTPTACETPHTSAQTCSNASSSWPSTYQPESITLETAASMSSLRIFDSALKSFIKIITSRPNRQIYACCNIQ